MYKVTVNGHVFRSPFNNMLKDTVSMLPYTFLINDIISKDEWTVSQQTIADKFKLTLFIEKLDGRTKYSKQLPYFTWRILMPDSKVKII